MTPTPKWYLPVTIVALLWNLLGCAAYLADVTSSPEAVAQMSPAMQELYRSRPAWAVAATAIGVWFGAAGSLGLVLRKRWAKWLLLGSLLGVLVQDFALLSTGAIGAAGPAAMVLQGVVLVVAIGLVVFARAAITRGWIGGAAAK